MTQIHILTPGLTSQNGQAFLSPLLRFEAALQARGIAIRLFTSDGDKAALCDCDLVILDSKFYSALWPTRGDEVEAKIARLAESAGRLVYFDTTDSSGFDHARALPHVTLYLKNQLLKDRSAYLRPLYGYRVFTDYYHETCGIRDADEARAEPVTNPALLEKLQVGWNSALLDYSRLGPLRMALYRRLSLRFLLQPADRFAAPDRDRPIALSARFGRDHPRNSVAYQRRAILERLGDRVASGRLSRRDYLKELESAKIVISPFGFGEICYRDYEGFLAGALVLKPDMSHMETWPDLFRDGETIASHRWDLGDLDETIEGLLADDGRRLAIARQGQETYRRYLIGEEAARLFIERVQKVLAMAGGSACRAAQ